MLQVAIRLCPCYKYSQYSMFLSSIFTFPDILSLLTMCHAHPRRWLLRKPTLRHPQKEKKKLHLPKRTRDFPNQRIYNRNKKTAFFESNNGRKWRYLHPKMQPYIFRDKNANENPMSSSMRVRCIKKLWPKNTEMTSGKQCLLRKPLSGDGIDGSRPYLFLPKKRVFNFWVIFWTAMNLERFLAMQNLKRQNCLRYFEKNHSRQNWI